ncbi:hypothetical protein SUGI_0644790 [Cryptomeria japonica]|nr:hypothetical protein SUGI_0644790 [Cryptomeria japonica]
MQTASKTLRAIWCGELRGCLEASAELLTANGKCAYREVVNTPVANDAPGRGILAELEADGVNTSYIVVSETGNSPFTYVIVDEQTKSISLDCLIRRRKAKRSVVFYQFLFSHEVGSLKAPGIGSVAGRLLIGTAEAIPPADLVDTTGARDGFIGAVLYAIAAGMPPENMLPFAARVATAGCRALGVRSGLPHRSDLCLTPYLV